MENKQQRSYLRITFLIALVYLAGLTIPRARFCSRTESWGVMLSDDRMVLLANFRLFCQDFVWLNGSLAYL